MIKALLKKQLLEFFSGFAIKGKNGAKNKKNNRFTAGLLLFFVLLVFASMFFSMAMMMSPVLETGEEWIYFAVFGIISTFMGILGSVFMAYSSLYAANDNDMLLAMPIPPAYILFARITGLYISTISFQAMVYIPAMIVFIITKGFVFFVSLLSFFGFLVLPVTAL